MNLLNSTARIALFTLLTAAIPLTSVTAQAGDKPQKFAVVQVDQEVRVLAADKVDALKADLKLEHKDALEAHKAAKAEARKNKEKFDEPLPKPKKLKVVKPSLDKEAADKLAEELRQKGPAKGAGKQKPAKKKKGSGK